MRSSTVWRLTYDATMQRLIPTPAEEMATLADPLLLKTLKPNGMALGPDGNLYISDLTEPYIRQMTNPAGDPRLQTIGIVATTTDLRGANGTMGFIGSKLYVSENRAAAWFDITSACMTPVGPAVGPSPFVQLNCASNPINLPSGVFIAGVATDGARYVYASHSAGGAAATIYRFDTFTEPAGCIGSLGAGGIPDGVVTCGTQAPIYAEAGNVPAAGTPNAVTFTSTTGIRPFNPLLTPGGTTGFSFVFGMSVDATTGALMITDDPTAGNRNGRGHIWTVPFTP